MGTAGICCLHGVPLWCYRPDRLPAQERLLGFCILILQSAVWLCLPLFAQGDLSLLAQPGGRGLPRGHIVAYQPTHALQAAFVQRMAEALE